MKYTTTLVSQPFVPPPMEGMMMMGGFGPTVTPLSTTYYYYNEEGNVILVTTQKDNPAPGEPEYTSTRLTYALNGRAVVYVSGEEWDQGGSHTTTFVREFRYDEGRQRYLDREWDSTLTVVLDEVWTRYDGDEAYFDHRTGDGSIGFEPGTGKIDPWTTDSTAGNTQYYHGDLIGTTRFMTDAGGNHVDEAVYTAFGERVSGTMGDLGDRYGYAGSGGYQAHEEFPFLHVGHRYYAPSTGRFLQRDPIGIFGGRNVYAYARHNPPFYVDPSALGIFGDAWDTIKDIGKDVWEVVKRLPPYVLPSPPVPADPFPDMACAYMGDALRRHILKDHAEDPQPNPKCPACRRLTPR